MKVIPVGEADPTCERCGGEGSIVLFRLREECFCKRVQQLITEEGEEEFDATE